MTSKIKGDYMYCLFYQSSKDSRTGLPKITYNCTYCLYVQLQDSHSGLWPPCICTYCLISNFNNPYTILPSCLQLVLLPPSPISGPSTLPLVLYITAHTTSVSRQNPLLLAFQYAYNCAYCLYYWLQGGNSRTGLP